MPPIDVRVKECSGDRLLRTFGCAGLDFFAKITPDATRLADRVSFFVHSCEKA